MSPRTELLARCPLCGVYDGIEGETAIFTTTLEDGSDGPVTDDLPQRMSIEGKIATCGCCDYTFPLEYLFSNDPRLLQSPILPQLFDQLDPFKLATTSPRSELLVVQVLCHGPVTCCECCGEMMRPGRSTYIFSIVDGCGENVVATVHQECVDDFSDVLYHDDFEVCDCCGIYVADAVSSHYAAEGENLCPDCFFKTIRDSTEAIDHGSLDVFPNAFNLYGKAEEEGFRRANVYVARGGLELDPDVRETHLHLPIQESARGLEAYVAMMLLCSGLTVVCEDDGRHSAARREYRMWIREDAWTTPTKNDELA